MAKKQITLDSPPITWSNVDKSFTDINDNFTEIFNLVENISVGNIDWDFILNKPEFSSVALTGSYNDLIDKPTNITSYTQLDDLPVLFSGSYNDLIDKPTLITSYTQLDDLPVLFSGSYNDLIDKPTLITSYTQLDDLPVLFSGSYNDLIDKPFIPTDINELDDEDNLLMGGSGLTSRSIASGTTVSIANGATSNLTIQGFKGYVLYKIETSAAAWVRLYTSSAARTADGARFEGVDPAPGAGVIAEVITTGADIVLISPGTIGFNDEAEPTTNIELAVTNKSGSSAEITVSLTIVKIEE